MWNKVVILKMAPCFDNLDNSPVPSCKFRRRDSLVERRFSHPSAWWTSQSRAFASANKDLIEVFRTTGENTSFYNLHLRFANILVLQVVL